MEQFFPQRLIDEAKPENFGEIPLSRTFCFAILDLFPEGVPRTVLAAYTNGVSGAIRVLQAGPGGAYTVLFEPTSLSLSGVDCGVELVDVDGDGVKEAHVSYVTFPGRTVDWIFRWDGSQLLSIGPTERLPNGMEGTTLRNLWLVDVDHSGMLSAVSVDGDFREELPTAAYSLYRLSGGRYVLDRPLLFVSTFVRRKSSPQVVKRQFSLLQDSNGPYVLRVINGKRGGIRRVSSARIVLNGVEVLSPNNFSQQVEFLSLPVTLLPRNTIEVTLAGEPLGEIFVTVEDTSKTSPSQ